MARKSTVDQIAVYGVVAAGAWLAYNMGLQGTLGSGIQSAMRSIQRAMFGGVGVLPPSPGPSPAPGPRPAPCTFVPGHRYVYQDVDGSFGVVWNGAFAGTYSAQSSAEQAYNALVARDGCI